MMPKVKNYFYQEKQNIKFFGNLLEQTGRMVTGYVPVLQSLVYLLLNITQVKPNSFFNIMNLYTYETRWHRST